MRTYVNDSGLHVPAGAAAPAGVRPMRWTETDTLETDPYGFAPVPAEDTDGSDRAAGEPEGVGPINQGEQDRETGAGNGPLARRGQRLADGRTWWVTRRGRKAAEQRRLAAGENPQVIAAERGVADAERLEAIDTDPRTEARSNRRVRTWVHRLIAASITGGLAISSSTAQATIVTTMGWSAGFGFWAAYGADPVLGVLLFALLFCQSLATNRGMSLPPATRTAFARAEWSLFGLVAALNGGPAAAAMIRSVAVAAGAGPQLLSVLDVLGHGVLFLVIHLLGPVLVGLAVYVLPHVTDVLATISTATSRRLAALRDETGPVGVSLVDRRRRVPERFRGDFDRAVAAIDDGALPLDPTGGDLYRHLGGDAGKKKPLREALAGYRPEQVAA